MNITQAITEIREQRRNVGFDSYDITVKQLIDMVAENQLKVAPEYQRHFVWDKVRQSALIESIFLGIPLPSLFMATNDDSTWEVIDGLQRLTTLIHFVNYKLNEHKENNVTPLRALLEIRYDMFSRGFARDSKAGCGRQHNEAAWPELHARRNAIRLI